LDVVFNNRPPLPFLVRMMNDMGRAGKLLVSLAVDNLLGAAVKRAGLADFGDSAFKKGMDRYVESLERDADLSTLGRITARAGIAQFLEQRLAVIDHVKRHPWIEHEEIRRPLFIIGLPRMRRLMGYFDDTWWHGFLPFYIGPLCFPHPEGLLIRS
jgi:hypothetical protein